MVVPECPSWIVPLRARELKQRAYGPEWMLSFGEQTDRKDAAFFYGETPIVAVENLRSSFRDLRVGQLLRAIDFGFDKWLPRRGYQK
jgi:hypothetical protein